MDFVENPKLFIIEYYNDKKNQIDLNCESLINESKDVTINQSLNELRINLIDQIESVMHQVLQRYDTFNLEYTNEMIQNNTKQIKDEIFLDQYCFVLEVYEVIPLFELKIGLLLFTEFEDCLLKNFKKQGTENDSDNEDMEFFYQLIYSTIINNLEKFRSNVIHLEKGKWLENGEIDSYNRNINFSSLEPFADKLKILTIFDSNFNVKLTKNDARILRKFINLERMKLYFSQIISLDANFFNSFENLSYLFMECNYLVHLPEFLFSSLINLKELDLILNQRIELNKNHFIGIKNLNTLKLCGLVLNDDLETLINLKELDIRHVQLNKFSLNELYKLERLKLIYFKFTEQRLKFQRNFFQNLKNLKYLEICNLEQPLGPYIEDHKVLFKQILYNIPKNVESLKTNSSFFEYLNYIETPFIYELKNLEVKFDKKGILEDQIKQNMGTFSLFKENLFFKNLQSLCLSWETDRSSTNYCVLSTEQFKNMKNLKSLTLKGFLLTGLDYDLNCLDEASFSIRMPENISNFINLEIFCLEDFNERISLNERFLQDLINLKELSLDKVFDSIDEDVQFLFKSLTKLKKLTLTNNKMNILKSSYFDYLLDLEEVNLTHNKIKIIESGSFKNSKKIKLLNLSGNCLKEIKKDTFHSNTLLEKICFS